jgi:tryptophanyl-tRNA synthetase
MVIPGTDGRKMSKSYGNVIDVFLPERSCAKQVMGIVTDSTPLEDPKNPETCNVFALYRLLGDEPQVKEMRDRYLAGGFGYGHAKQALFEVIMDGFTEERTRFNALMEDPEQIDRLLKQGAEKARPTAMTVLSRLRDALGYGK